MLNEQVSRSPSTESIEAANQLAALVDSSDDAIISKDLNGYIRSWNRAAERIFGYSEREAVGQHITILIPPDLRQEETDILSRVRMGLRVDHYETTRKRKDGRMVAVSLTVSPIKDNQGTIVGASKIARDISERRKSDDMARQLAAIVESSDDAIVSKDLSGTIKSWNKAAERLFGYSEREAVGRHITMLIPHELLHEEDTIIGHVRAGRRVDHYETRRRHKSGKLIDVALTVSPIRTADGIVVGASKIARDISQRKAAEALIERLKTRYETLNAIAKRLASDLDLDRVVEATTDIATQLTGAKFGAFFYNVTNEKGESYQLFSLSGAPRESFEKLGMPRNTAVFAHTFSGIGPMRSDDIRKDPRYGKSAPHHGQPMGHLPVVSYLAVPVVSRSGAVHGGLFFAHDEPGVFDLEAEELAMGIASHAAIAIDNAHLHKSAEAEIERRKRAEDTKELLLHEMKHRVKNMLSTIDAVASQTLREVPAHISRDLSARIRALAQAHDLLTQHDWKGVDLQAIADRSLTVFKDRNSGRLEIVGPAVTLDANKSLLMSLTFHELATNAVKYGAWSNETGKVSVAWDIDPATSELRLSWQESGGPAVVVPQRRGFGSTLIQRALVQGQGTATMVFDPAGVICKVTMAV